MMFLAKKKLKFKRKGTTIAGGLDPETSLAKINSMGGICVDENNNLYIADSENHRILQWKIGLDSGTTIAGGNGPGNDIDQFNFPVDVLIDKFNNNSLIICDHRNKRVLRWFFEQNKYPEIIIEDIFCHGLALDKDGSLYVSDYDTNSVRRWKQEEINGTIVAGGNGRGDSLNQLNFPAFIAIDDNITLYISDSRNARVMKWLKNSTEGIILNGIQNKNRVKNPQGLVLDYFGQLYIADSGNHRILRWNEENQENEIIINVNGYGRWSGYLYMPYGLTFDNQQNLLVNDFGNHRVQKFDIMLD
ncbi:unnamed protein product [Adineta ricciae]|uniref:Uncharacterized protein n=1 Tax=Adineta ricciae TaxID=249248 RepID=A0A814WJ36_ADIRI|nr:unnamed protein product [Adineta ricciae]CAF1460829.1 unnamed protein product [Adineta ricciae]